MRFLAIAVAVGSLLSAVAFAQDTTRDSDRRVDRENWRYRHHQNSGQYQPGPARPGDANPYASKAGAANPYATQGGVPNPYATQGGTPNTFGARGDQDRPAAGAAAPRAR